MRRSRIVVGAALLAVAGLVTGALVSANETPIKGRVAWLPESGPPIFQTSTDAEGRFQLDAMPYGRQWLRAVVEGRDPIDVELDVQPPPHENHVVIRVP